jgi:hypothetical protein
VGETISLDVRVPESSKNVKIRAQCSDKEKTKFSKLLGGFQDVFAWSYEDIHGFDPSLILHAIPIKEGMKPVKNKQGHINSAFKAMLQRELENFLRVGIIFPVEYLEWVSNWGLVSKVTDHVRTYINFHTFS